MLAVHVYSFYGNFSGALLLCVECLCAGAALGPCRTVTGMGRTLALARVWKGAPQHLCAPVPSCVPCRAAQHRDKILGIKRLRKGKT